MNRSLISVKKKKKKMARFGKEMRRAATESSYILIKISQGTRKFSPVPASRAGLSYAILDTTITRTRPQRQNEENRGRCLMGWSRGTGSERRGTFWTMRIKPYHRERENRVEVTSLAEWQRPFHPSTLNLLG